MTSFINDNGQEILVSEEVTLTKQVASFKEFKIKGDFSVTLKIHNNSKNREALGYYGLNQIDSPIFSPNKFNLVKNGNVLKRGDIVIESDDGNFISIYFIAGNSNWFRAFDFSCKDVRNDSLAVQWNYTNVITASTATSGIVFPHIDFMFGREKFDKYNFNSRIVNDSTGEVDDYSPVNNSPCIYLSTLVNEISKVGGIKIAGNILTDWLYTHVIITPDGPEIYNEIGQIVTSNAGAPTSSGGNDTPIKVLAQEEYMRFGVKTTTGLTTQVWYQPLIENGIVHCYPVPSASNTILFLELHYPFQKFVASSDNPDFPPEWLNAIIYGLAVNLGYRTGMEEKRLNMLKQDAEYWHQYALGTSQEESVFFQPDRTTHANNR